MNEIPRNKVFTNQDVLLGRIETLELALELKLNLIIAKLEQLENKTPVFGEGNFSISYTAKNEYYGVRAIKENIIPEGNQVLGKDALKNVNNENLGDALEAGKYEIALNIHTDKEKLYFNNKANGYENPI